MSVGESGCDLRAVQHPGFLLNWLLLQTGAEWRGVRPRASQQWFNRISCRLPPQPKHSPVLSLDLTLEMGET